ncbi:MAG TPA: type II secretion system protein GspG [Candidatus Hydrogenedens sp.]|nr:type II secretion system protein GspG [Candidatus Hydrogenedens sp.]HOK08423.1 type II secretion system protein GspG [Candidatus Hydrogenedens sp.]HOL19454.1 type II secretion system protein GspG [Candidatus Hydrogenedens sp.]HPP58164.1 type II secretion system protein GspG [Candidatus Hydrogenedens sp.]
MTKQQKTEKKTRQLLGFTLVELMVVIAIIAILATTVGIYVFGALDDADQAKAKAEISNLKTAVQMYRIKNKRLPNTLDEAAQFLDPPKVPLDPWGNPYIYQKEGNSSFKIMSYGADGSAGGSGANADISSDD